jgi:hypothetical protein
MAAAGKFKLYQAAKANIANGLIDLDSHAFKIALFLSTSNANDLSVGTGLLADLTNQHANGNGYATGGVALAGVTWAQAAGVAKFDANDLAPAWTASGGPITARFAVIYDDTAAGDPLLCVCLLDATPADVTATDGNPFNITFNASGIFTLSGATAD